MSLNDREIRAALVGRLSALPIKPRAVIQELRVHNGNAIADLVTVHSGTHCYEIKGEADVLQRIIKQGEYYNLAFQKITLVTTANHLKQAENVAPKHWGLMLASEDDSGVVKIRYMRRTQKNPSYDKRIALLTLWREELISGLQNGGQLRRNTNREQLCALLSLEFSESAIDKFIGSKLISRIHRNG